MPYTVNSQACPTGVESDRTARVDHDKEHKEQCWASAVLGQCSARYGMSQYKSRSAKTRDTRLVAPPAATGTTSRIGLDGHASRACTVCVNSKDTAAKTRDAMLVKQFILPGLSTPTAADPRQSAIEYCRLHKSSSAFAWLARQYEANRTHFRTYGNAGARHDGNRLRARLLDLRVR